MATSSVETKATYTTPSNPTIADLEQFLILVADWPRDTPIAMQQFATRMGGDVSSTTITATMRGAHR
ncbi:hypothetical protein M1M07_07590 [Rhodococcus sp. HM1]|uniref:hypothetical protein n=1 Tax=Rhodococcus sp. HM1 TaxID=2937759 RepID=UPI00200A40E2|nr:hypothetical protein [Rhodococcus sp. HM1]MCK8670979.1 hypothetical protein [Rhodococcus sp. HM1]